MLVTDFIAYWFHRWSHQVNFLWAAHIVHHQSEQLNITTVFRVSFFAVVFRACFFVWMAFAGFDVFTIVTTSLFSSWDNQFYPKMNDSGGMMLIVDCDNVNGGMKIRSDFIVDFGNERHGFLAFNDIQSEYYQLPKSDKDVLKQEEEEIREELNKATENIDENENQESPETIINLDSDERNNENTQDTVNNNGDHLDKKIEKIRGKRKKRYRIQEVIKPGQVILMQRV